MPLSEINKLSAAETAGRIADRSLSAVEVVDEALRRLEETEPALNAFVHVDHDGARRAAIEADVAVTRGDVLGRLHGVPVSVKDLIDVGGMPARYGSLTMMDNVAGEDAISVARMRDAGAIILGKTATSEFGFRGYTKSLVHGNTRNPWNLGRTPGGSSGGAVASVAAGVTPLALGSDGGGSVRMPCALTGLVGIKATAGRIPFWPASSAPTLSHIGPIARTVDDAALLLSVCAGPDRRDSHSLILPVGGALAPDDARKLRVAFSPTLGYAMVDSHVATTVADAVGKLERTFECIEQVDCVCEEEGEIFVAEFIGGCSARLGDLVDTVSEKIDPILLSNIRDFRSSSVDRYTRLLRRRVAHRDRLRRFFERFDVLITPTTSCTAWDIDAPVPPGHENRVWTYFTYPFNLSGQPAASMTCGYSPDGLPVGLQLVAGLCDEAKLLTAMRLVEQVLSGVGDTPIEPRALAARVCRIPQQGD